MSSKIVLEPMFPYFCLLTGYQPEVVSTADISVLSWWNWISITLKKGLMARISRQSWSGTAESVNWHARLERLFNDTILVFTDEQQGESRRERGTFYEPRAVAVYFTRMIRSDGLMDICKDYSLKKYSSASILQAVLLILLSRSCRRTESFVIGFMSWVKNYPKVKRWPPCLKSVRTKKSVISRAV